MKEGRIDKSTEPFSVRLKQFWDITQAGSLLSDKFSKMLSHEPDGLVFQPSKDVSLVPLSIQMLSENGSFVRY
jgi:mRNA-capping enzyme